LEREVWFVVEFSGTPVGIGRDRWLPLSDGVFYESYLEIRASRLGTPIEMISRIEEWDDGDRALLRFEAETSINGELMRSAGQRRNGAIYVTSEGSAYSQADTVQWVAGAVGTAWIDEEIREHVRGGHTEFSINTFDPRFASVRRNHFRVSPVDDDAAAIVLDQFDEGVEFPMARLWLDGNYEIYRMESRQLNLTLSLRRVDPADISQLTLDPNFDMIRDQMIPCLGYPARSEDLDEVEFTLTFSRPFADASGFSGPNQRVLSRNGNTMTIVVTREPAAVPAPEATQLQSYLEPARYIQSDAPVIRAVADSLAAATGAAGAPLANEIAQWVGAYVTEKGYGRGFSSAVEVMASREGDCSEHSVLLAALLRASGIPARIAVGLAYDNGSLIGHMWTEAYVERWITLDALDRGNDPKRIRIASSPDARAIDEAGVVNAYSLVAGLEVNVTNHRP
jgi:hypothetical protein